MGCAQSSDTSHQVRNPMGGMGGKLDNVARGGQVGKEFTKLKIQPLSSSSEPRYNYEIVSENDDDKDIGTTMPKLFGGNLRLQLKHIVSKSNDNEGKFVLFDVDNDNKMIAICQRSPTDFNLLITSENPSFPTSKPYSTIKSSGKKIYEWAKVGMMLDHEMKVPLKLPIQMIDERGIKFRKEYEIQLEGGSINTDLHKVTITTQATKTTSSHIVAKAEREYTNKKTTSSTPAMIEIAVSSDAADPCLMLSFIITFLFLDRERSRLGIRPEIQAAM